MSADLIAQAIKAHWGDRCTDFDADCACCRVWARYDALEAAEARIASVRAESAEECARVADEAFPAIDGFGASFNRELDAWVLYTTPSCERIGQIDGYDPKKVEFVLAALRAWLPAAPAPKQEGA